MRRTMDPRVLSASTRVFDALLPAGDVPVCRTRTADSRSFSPSWPGLTRPSIFFVQTATRAELGFWVYILANRRGGTLYVGVTNDLIRRAFEHREGLIPGFTKRYGITMLVYYERHDTAAAAIQKEKNIK